MSRDLFKIKNDPLITVVDGVKDVLENNGHSRYLLSDLQIKLILTRTGGIVDPKIIKTIATNRYDISKGMYNLIDLKKAGMLVDKHIKNKSYILVVSDYDADGITSGVVIYKTLVEILNIPKELVKFIVNKRENGNGFNPTLTKFIIDKHGHAGLIIASDHGSSDEASYKEFKKLDIDLLITDHHEVPKNNFPVSADVFVNPQRPKQSYHKDISGCFVAFLTMLSVYAKQQGVKVTNDGGLDITPFHYLFPYIAISTITDVMSIKNPINRYVVRVGLNELNALRDKRWYAIKKALGINGLFRSKDLGYKLGPLINTGNRTKSTEIVKKILVSNNLTTIEYGLKSLGRLNIKRKQAQNKVLNETLSQIDMVTYPNSSVVCIKTDVSIAGTIAAMVGRKVNKPTVCFNKPDSVSQDIIFGSCRGIVSGLNLIEIFDSIKQEDSDILTNYGGHKAAAGCGIYENKLTVFQELFDKYASRQLEQMPVKDTLSVDNFITATRVDINLAREIELCSPYGKDWEEPSMITVMKLKSILTMGNIAKLTMVVSEEDPNRLFKERTIEAMHFYDRPSLSYPFTNENIRDKLKVGEHYKIVFNIDIQIYNRTHKPMMTIIDIVPYDKPV